MILRRTLSKHPHMCTTTTTKQTHLPRLPVPPLRKTLDRYLKSIQPFLLEDEARGGAPFMESYALRVRWAEEFEVGTGRGAQERLIALDKDPIISPYNWLDDSIWIKKAYHEWRVPLPVNSNWWLAFLNDRGVPAIHRVIPHCPPVSQDNVTQTTTVAVDGEGDWAGVTPWQVRRAALLVWRILDFKDRLSDSTEPLPTSITTRTATWLRDSTSRIFNTCRIPGVGRDSLSPQPPPAPGPALDGVDNTGKLLVVIHDWFYAVECYHPPSSYPSPPVQADSDSTSAPTTPTRTKISPTELERRLRAVARDATQRLSSSAGESAKAVPVGVLSSDGRDRWAQNYDHLRSVSPTNVRTFNTIHQSLFALSLDHYTYTFPSSSPTQISTQSTPSSTTKPTPPADLTSHLHQIRSTPDAHNRWYDKPLTIIVEPNTRAGAMGEHSPVDALVPSIVCEYAVVQSVEGAFEGGVTGVGGSVGVGGEEVGKEAGWERLHWEVDERIERECERAEVDARALITDSDDSGLWFNDYGADWIKDVAKLSPDAYVQMALQLAWYRSRGEFTATYETALTRMFVRGRTETIRTFTVDSRAWVLSMMDRGAPQSARLTHLHRALKTHASLTREAATGKGIDRHLLGLRVMLDQSPDVEPCPKLFEDELFERSQRWKLSTSGLSAGHHFRGTGFGAAYQDGYGINYLAGPEVIKFGIESKHSNLLTSTGEFKAAICEALQDMRYLCLSGLESSNHPVISSHL